MEKRANVYSYQYAFEDVAAILNIAAKATV